MSYKAKYKYKYKSMQVGKPGDPFDVRIGRAVVDIHDSGNRRGKSGLL